MSLQRRNGQVTAPAAIARVLSELSRNVERSHGVLGKRALWLAQLHESDEMEPDPTLRYFSRGGRLLRPIRDPDGTWHTPEQDRAARELDRAIKHGLVD